MRLAVDRHALADKDACLGDVSDGREQQQRRWIDTCEVTLAPDPAVPIQAVDTELDDTDDTGLRQRDACEVNASGGSRVVQLVPRRRKARSSIGGLKEWIGSGRCPGRVEIDARSIGREHEAV